MLGLARGLAHGLEADAQIFEPLAELDRVAHRDDVVPQEAEGVFHQVHLAAGGLQVGAQLGVALFAARQHLEVLLGDGAPGVAGGQRLDLVAVVPDALLEAAHVDAGEVLLAAGASDGEVEKVVDEIVELGQIVAEQIDGERGVLGGELLNVRPLLGEQGDALLLGGRQVGVLGEPGLLPLGLFFVGPDLVEPGAAQERRVGGEQHPDGFAGAGAHRHPPVAGGEGGDGRAGEQREVVRVEKGVLGVGRRVVRPGPGGELGVLFGGAAHGGGHDTTRGAGA
ncbi:MAG TPA: hypothetical protein VFS43_26950, partial [Polyangiaceae bacterium]|nr:hypothetical protein [Polyangiaceae bacterium]